MHALRSSTWVLALFCASQAGALPSGAELDRLVSYAELVERYRQGDAAALQALGALPEASVREATEHLSALARARREPPFSIPTAVLMHTDRALLDRTRGVREAETLQLGLARKLAESLGGEPASKDFRRRWYLAAAEAWKEGADWGFARELLEAGLKEYPKDPGLLVARAAMAETAAAFTDTAEEPAGPRRTNLGIATRRGMKRAADARQQRLAAAELLRRALAVAPADEQTRLRLGRVLLGLGQRDEALAALDSLRQEGREPRRVYMALLLYGGGLERSGRLADAIGSYRAAVALEPRAQAAHLALAHALDRAGAPGAASELDAALATTTRYPDFADPWWTYLFERTNLLDQLRAELRR